VAERGSIAVALIAVAERGSIAVAVRQLQTSTLNYIVGYTMQQRMLRRVFVMRVIEKFTRHNCFRLPCSNAPPVFSIRVWKEG